MRKLILASASPRRIELLKNAGLEAEVHPADVDESLPEGLTPEEAVKLLSARKAQAVFYTLTSSGNVEDGLIVLGADTVVSADGLILGKPADEEDAARMLKLLSGRKHTVCTGVTLLSAAGGKAPERDTFAETSSVYVDPLSEKEIAAYIASGEPMDKAGSYGIQGMFSRHVSRIEGDYFNIVGLPVSAVYGHLKKITS